MEPEKHEKSHLLKMNFPQKAERLFTYYKTHMLLAVLTFLGIIFAVYYIYRMQVDIVLNALVINSQGGDSNALGSDFRDFLEERDPLHEIFIDDTLLFTGSSLSDHYKEIKLASYLNNRLVDVMILDEAHYSRYKESGLLQPLFKIMSDEELKHLGQDSDDVLGIRITGNRKLQEYGFNIQGNVYLVVMQDAPCPENAKKFIQFLCE